MSIPTLRSCGACMSFRIRVTLERSRKEIMIRPVTEGVMDNCIFQSVSLFDYERGSGRDEWNRMEYELDSVSHAKIYH